MPVVILFIKDFEFSSKISSICSDLDYRIEFTDEKTDPNDFSDNISIAIVDMDEKVFSSVGLISALKNRGLKIIGTVNKINNKERSKLQSAGIDIIVTRKSLIRNIPNLFSQLIV